MKYRKLPHGEEQISIIGMGSSVIGEQAEKDIIKTVHFAMDAELIILIWPVDTQVFFRHMGKL